MMNKDQIISMMAELADGTKKDAEKYLEAFRGTVELAVEKHEKLNLMGLFSMEVAETKQRVGRNPKTQEEVIIPAGHSIKIKPSKKLKELL